MVPCHAGCEAREDRSVEGGLTKEGRKVPVHRSSIGQFEEELGGSSFSASPWGSGPVDSIAPLWRCYESHKSLTLGKTGLVVYGGSCSMPVVSDADIYIGFDASMSVRPWPSMAQQILFKVPDMSVPGESEAYLKLVEWAVAQIVAGKKVHAGCIGGHGRTGMFLAAIVSVLCKEDRAIDYVRKHYCNKAIESSVQIDFLAKYFGIVKEKPAKTGFTSLSKAFKSLPTTAASGRGTSSKKTKMSGVRELVQPIKSKFSIWG